MLIGMKRLAPLINKVNTSFVHEQAYLDEPSRSAEELSLSLFGREVTNYLMDPLVRMLSGTSAKRASSLDLISSLAMAKHADATCTFLGGQDLLVRTLAAKLTISYDSRATSILESRKQAEVACTDEAGNVKVRQADVVVLAVMFDEAVKLYPHFGKISSRLLREIPYISTMKIFLAYDTKVNCDAYVISMPSLEDDEVMAIFLDQNKYANRVPRGHSLLHLNTDVNVAGKMMSKSDSEVEHWARKKMETLFPELAGHFIFVHVARWPKMGNFSAPGYFKGVSDVVKQLPVNARVQIAGDMFTKVHQEGAAAWGQRAAENIIANF
jgi:protoporphyrinogen oxidase